MTPLILAVQALVLCGPVPWLVSRWRLPLRAPRAAIVFWQALALAAVLSALGAGLSVATSRLHGSRTDALDVAVAALALVLTLVVVSRLLLAGHLTGTRLRAIRRTHRERVDLVAAADGLAGASVTGRPARAVRVLEHPAAVAYCLPGLRSSRIVLSTGALGLLDATQLDAVLAHERAHLRARHDLVVEAFTVLHAAFPRPVSSRSALGSVRLLVEVLADRAAARTSGRPALAQALVQLVDAQGPAPDLVGLAAVPPLGSPSGSRGGSADAAGASGDVLTRVQLLRDGSSHAGAAALLLVLAAALLVLPTVLVAVPWLTHLS